MMKTLPYRPLYIVSCAMKYESLYCIFVLLEDNIADRTQQMEQANLTKVNILRKEEIKRGSRNVNMWKSGENQLDWTHHKLRSTDNDWSWKSPNRYMSYTIRKRQRRWIDISYKNGNSIKQWMEIKQETIHCLCDFTIMFTLFYCTHHLALFI